MSDPIVFTRLYLPRPLTATSIDALLTRLAGSDVPRPVVFEVQATADGTAVAFGCAPTAVHRLKRLLAAHVPGVSFGAASRAPVAGVGRVTARPGGLLLADADPERTLHNLYQAFAARRGDEVIGVQLILGRVHRPQQLQAAPLDPLQSVGSVLLDGIRPAATEIKKRLHAHAAQARFDIVLRIGVQAQTAKRRRALMWEVFGALQPLESPGVRLSLVRDAPARWASGAAGPGTRLRLGTSELVPLLGWPLGDNDYPGVPGVHPRLLPVPEVVSRTEAVFATGTAPGPVRLIGIDPLSRLEHAVILGPTGSGKSTLLLHLILADVRAHRACVVIEPKKQLIDAILDALNPEEAEDVVVLDATDAEAPVGFNPLDVGDRDPDIVVDGILAALAAVFNDSWGPRTEYLIQGALLSLARAGQQRGVPYTLIDLPQLFTDDALRRPVIAAVQDDTTLAAFWAEFEGMRPAQRAAVIASPLNKLRKIVMRKPLVRVLGQSQPRFRLRDVFRERKTILVPLNNALLGSGASQLLGSLIVAELFLAATERAAEKNPTKRPGMVFIDEVQNYLHLPTSVEDAMSVFRSFGVGLHVAHQYRAQLPAGMLAGLDTNARSKICFSLEVDDATAMAKRAPQLTAADIQALPKRNVYARLVVGDSPTEWCSAATLPPPPVIGQGEKIRAASQDRYGQIPTSISTTIAAPKPERSSENPTEDGRRPYQKARRS